ncbi:MAG TPA: nicotinamidase [Solirubrobacteraceae bacterium]|jgi:nicotinamidase-related amidase|nr:nicotinamidase [Solirubrobacteraceae bacterium]
MPEALIIVDFQRDFTPPAGALSVPHGDEIAPRLNELARDARYAAVIATRDWHPADHGSFVEQGGPWPSHCVQNTDGAQLHPALQTDRVDAIIDKGQSSDSDGYSAFESAELTQLLREEGITAVTVVGLATDYCVLNTARDALRDGLLVTVDTSATRAVDVRPGDGERALDELRSLGARVVP